ncbi:UNVERIFIED_CONTAM: hypothetical protein GTU68_013267 [Idotea baltica]|nr:hypothetical protein [Idotea baltica]
MEKDIGTEFGVHNGKDFFIFTVQAEMVGFKFGDFALTRKYPKVPLKWLKAKKKFN